MSDDLDPPRDGEESGERPYEVGYGKPPVHTRFGQGNRASTGRPSGSRNVRTIFEEAFAHKRSGKINGERVVLSRAELALRHLANRAADGDHKATAQYLQYADKWSEADPVAKGSATAQSRNLDIVQNLFALAKLTGEAKADPDESQGDE